MLTYHSYTIDTSVMELSLGTRTKRARIEHNAGAHHHMRTHHFIAHVVECMDVYNTC